MSEISGYVPHCIAQQLGVLINPYTHACTHTHTSSVLSVHSHTAVQRCQHLVLQCRNCHWFENSTESGPSLWSSDLYRHTFDLFLLGPKTWFTDSDNFLSKNVYSIQWVWKSRAKYCSTTADPNDKWSSGVFLKIPKEKEKYVIK